jgi:hypothetical protein
MAVFVLAPDLRRLADLLVLNRPTLPAAVAPRRFDRGWLRLGRLALKAVVIAYFLISLSLEAWQRWEHTVKRSARYRGRSTTYTVDEFFRNGRLVPTSPSDSSRWQSLYLGPGGASVNLMNSEDMLAAAYDPAQQVLAVFSSDHKTELGLLACSWGDPDKDHLSLTGRVANDSLVVTLHRLDASKFLLVRRGFHWINEFPLNR